MYLASVAALSAAAQLADDRVAALPPADVLREQMLGHLRDFVARCRAAGIADVEAAEARYALVAFIDDRILKSNWAGRAEWQKSPLQLQFYREFTAGENFYARMGALVQRGGPLFPLECYYSCLALGFAGAQPGANAPQAARRLLDGARALLLHGHGADRIAPNAVPTDRHDARPRPFPVARAVVVACAVVCALALLGLHASMSHVLERTAAHLTAVKTNPAPTPAGGR
jgi:type VI secretion system protein ImpK